MDRPLKIIHIVLFLFCFTAASFAQDASVIINSGSYVVSSKGAYLVLPGDIHTDGNINTDSLSYWNFIGSIQQRITCKTGISCPEIFNSNSYSTVLGNVNLNNSNGLAIETNTKVGGTHNFSAGFTEMKEGNYSFSLDAAALNPGIYYAVMRTNEHFLTRRFAVVHE